MSLNITLQFQLQITSIATQYRFSEKSGEARYAISHSIGACGLPAAVLTLYLVQDVQPSQIETVAVDACRQ